MRSGSLPLTRMKSNQNRNRDLVVNPDFALIKPLEIRVIISTHSNVVPPIETPASMAPGR